MKLNLSLFSFATVLTTLLLVKTSVAWQFNIPRLHTLQPAGSTANATVRCKYSKTLYMTHFLLSQPPLKHTRTENMHIILAFI